MAYNQLNDLNIFNLRELARKVGVKSPTSKVKNILIKEIIDIQEGRLAPTTEKAKGRPPKSSIVSVNNVLDSLSNVEVSKNLVFNQSEEGENISKDFELSGYFEAVGSSACFIWEQNGTSFKKHFANIDCCSDNVRSGDYVDVCAYSVGQNLRIKNFISINDVEIENFGKRIPYEDLEHQIPEKHINFSSVNFEMLFGENVYVVGDDNIQNTKFVVDLLNNCDADSKIYLNLTVVEKNKIYFKSLLNSEMFLSNLTDDIPYSQSIVNMCVERTKRLMEMGKNVLVVVDDIYSLFSSDDDQLTLSRKLFSLTKNSKNGSISFVIVKSTEKPINVIEKLIDKKYKLTNMGVVKI